MKASLSDSMKQMAIVLTSSMRCWTCLTMRASDIREKRWRSSSRDETEGASGKSGELGLPLPTHN